MHRYWRTLSRSGAPLNNKMTPVMRNARMADMITAKTRKWFFLTNMEGKRDLCSRGAIVIRPMHRWRTVPVFLQKIFAYPEDSLNRADELNVGY